MLFAYFMLTFILKVSEATKQPQWPKRSNLTSDLILETFITHLSKCMLPTIAILLASVTMAASKQPQGSPLTSEMNSVFY